MNNTHYHSVLLSHDKVNLNKLKGFAAVAWFFFGDRSYARNRQFSEANWYYGIYLLMAVFFTAVFCAWKIFFVVMLGVIAANAMALGRPLRDANQSFYPGFMNLLIGVIGYYAHLRFGFSVFDFHLEPYLFAAYAIAGGLAVYRRLWNALIWILLDRIVIHYYHQQGYILRG